MRKNSKKAFTLIEIMVVIILIMIFYLWIRNLNFNSKTNEQNLEIFSNKIISLLENTRNDVLFWKIKEGSTNFEKTMVEEILVDKNINKIWNIVPSKKEKIEKIYCNKDQTKTIDWNPQKFKIVFLNNKIWVFSETTTDFERWELKCNNIFLSQLNILVSFNWVKFEIEIDTVSWLIKKTKK